MQFDELLLSQEVLKAVEAMGFTEMTEIQEKSIPMMMEGVDLIGRSNTGTGKTVAFGIPAVESIDHDGNGSVQVLILCPTRELAMQACDEIKKLAKYMHWVKPCAVYGGASMDKQIFALKRGANIVVGTPGRVMDHINRRTLKLHNLKTIILDEADEMLNMGFREDIETILQDVPEERQTVLFSATMPPEIMAITKQYQRDPLVIKIAANHRTVDTIEQYYFETAMGRKTDALRLLLLAYEPNSSMVFCNTKKMVDELTETLCSKGIHAAGLHGDMKQMQRTQVMNAFKSGKTSVLVATDVAARGIDVSGIDAVFNYDLPQDNEYYIHRIGRTGRAGKSGSAYTLVSGRKQVFAIRDIARYCKAEIKQRALPTRAELADKKLDRLYEKLSARCEEQSGEQAQNLLARLNEAGYSTEQVALALLDRRVQKSLRAIPEFDAPQPIIREENGRNGRRRTAVHSVKVDISVGRQHRIAPNFILGALVDATGLPGKEFGKIDIFDRHTTVEVPESELEFVVDAMQGGKINGQKVTVKPYEGKETASRREYSEKPGRREWRKNSRHSDRRNDHRRQSKRYYG